MEKAAPQERSQDRPARGSIRFDSGKVSIVDVFDTVFDFIDMRSFSNLWYWIALAVFWSVTSHWVMGVPHDMLIRARREGGQVQTDVEELARISTQRILAAVRKGAFWIVALGSFWLTILGLLAFYYNQEFAQAVFFLLAPLAIVGWLSLRCARKIEAGEGHGDDLHRRLTIHRRWLQVVGMLCIFVTAMYGMWQNLNNSILS